MRPSGAFTRQLKLQPSGTSESPGPLPNSARRVARSARKGTAATNSGGSLARPEARSEPGAAREASAASAAAFAVPACAERVASPVRRCAGNRLPPSQANCSTAGGLLSSAGPGTCSAIAREAILMEICEGHGTKSETAQQWMGAGATGAASGITSGEASCVPRWERRAAGGPPAPRWAEPPDRSQGRDRPQWAPSRASR